MRDGELVTEEDVIRTAQECSDGIMKRYAVCAEAMLGIPDPAAFRAAVEELREANEEVVRTSMDCVTTDSDYRFSTWANAGDRFHAALDKLIAMLPK